MKRISRSLSSFISAQITLRIVVPIRPSCTIIHAYFSVRLPMCTKRRKPLHTCFLCQALAFTLPPAVIVSSIIRRTSVPSKYCPYHTYRTLSSFHSVLLNYPLEIPGKKNNPFPLGRRGMLFSDDQSRSFLNKYLNLDPDRSKYVKFSTLPCIKTHLSTQYVLNA